MEDACGDSCSIFTGEYHKLFLPILKSGVIEFIQLEDRLRTVASANGLVNLVWKNDHWTKRIFNLKVYGTRKFQVEGMFLQLLTARMIPAMMITNELRWTICRKNTGETYPPFRYSDDNNWIGVHLLSDSVLN